MDTKVWASTTPAVVNGSRIPNHRSRYSPMNGSAKKATAMMATKVTGSGRPARALPGRRAAPESPTTGASRSSRSSEGPLGKDRLPVATQHVVHEHRRRVRVVGLADDSQ